MCRVCLGIANGWMREVDMRQELKVGKNYRTWSNPRSCQRCSLFPISTVILLSTKRGLIRIQIRKIGIGRMFDKHHGRPWSVARRLRVVGVRALVNDPVGHSRKTVIRIWPKQSTKDFSTAQDSLLFIADRGCQSRGEDGHIYICDTIWWYDIEFTMAT